MAVCKHCDGTGEVPDTILLECVSCQRKVKVTYQTTAELMSQCDNVRCSDCKEPPHEPHA